MSTTNDYVEEIRSSVSQLTGAEFKIMKPRAGFPPFGQNYRWFMRCPFIEDIGKMAHANSLWEDNSGDVWIESLPFGDTYDWVEYAYGEDAVNGLEKMDLAKFKDEATRKKFSEFYPFAYERLVNYERILGAVSRKYGVKLQFRYGGKGGLVVFFAEASVTVEGLAPREKLDKIKQAIKALEFAHNQTEKYSVEHAKSQPN